MRGYGDMENTDICGFFHLHIPLWHLLKLLEKRVELYIHTILKLGWPNRTRGRQNFWCWLCLISPPALFLALCSDTTLGNPERIPFETEGVHLSFPRTGWAAWPCIQMWTHQLCGAGSLCQAVAELLQMSQTKYWPALVLGWISLDVCQAALSVCQWAIVCPWLMGRQKMPVGRQICDIQDTRAIFSLFQEMRESILFNWKQ